MNLYTFWLFNTLHNIIDWYLVLIIYIFISDKNILLITVLNKYRYTHDIKLYGVKPGCCASKYRHGTHTIYIITIGYKQRNMTIKHIILIYILAT